MYAILPNSMILESISIYLKPWLLPPGLNIFICLLGIMLGSTKTLGRILIIFSVLSLWLFSTPLFSKLLIDSLQNQYSLVKFTTKYNTTGIIVVLGGGIKKLLENDNRWAISDITLDRLQYAAYLHKNTNFPIMVSGGVELNSYISEADLMSDTLKNNFQIYDILKEDKSHNTVEESKYLAPILLKNRYKIIYLVTNAWHMPRSVYIFNKAKINVIPAPMGYLNFDPSYKALLSYLPNKEALNATAIALHEYLGLFWYFICY